MQVSKHTHGKPVVAAPPHKNNFAYKQQHPKANSRVYNDNYLPKPTVAGSKPSAMTT